jgi:hypothetical protein
MIEKMFSNLLSVVGGISPATSRSIARAWDDVEHRDERGEVSISTIMWVAIGIVLAVSAGAILLTKTKTKAGNLDLDQNQAPTGVGGVSGNQ